MKSIFSTVVLTIFAVTVYAQDGQVSVSPVKAIGGLFKKKDKKQQENGNIIRLKDRYPQTTSNENYYDATRDLRKNPKLNYLYSNLITADDTAKVGDFMKTNGISYNFYNSEDEPIILWVIKSGNSKMLLHFLENGANPNLRTFYISYGPARFSDGQRNSESVYSKWPLEVALENFDTTKLNLLKGYDVMTEPLIERLQAYITDKRYGSFMARFLGSNQVAPDALWTYIHLTTKDEVQLNKVEDFINREANINYTASNAYGCLYEAMKRQYSNEIIKLLVSKGADVNIGVNEGSYTVGNYPICFAVKSNNLELVKLFVERGARTNIRCDGCNRSENSCLVQIAVNAKYNSIVEYFFSKGIN